MVVLASRTIACAAGFVASTLSVAAAGAAVTDDRPDGASQSAVWSDPWIADFCADEPGWTVIESNRPGRWSQPDTWGGSLPTYKSRVRIRHDVTFDGRAHAGSVCVEGSGALRFDPDKQTLLRVTTLTVGPDAILEIGRREQPVLRQAELVFADAPISPDADPGQYCNGLLVNGTLSIAGRPVGRSFVRLAREPRAGDRELLLETLAPDGWRPGDRVLVPDTRQHRADGRLSFRSHAEEARIAAVDGFAVRLDTPLLHDHRGAHAVDGQRPILPHVISLDRNVILRSERADGIRGHILLLDRARVDIGWAAFRDLGRTTLEVPDTAEFNEAGNATREPSNQIGRYALHLHHLTGPAQPPSDGWQFSLIGNVVENALKWSVVLHDSHFGLVRENVAYGFGGAGFVTEQGNESNNLFERNFAIEIVANEDVAVEIFPDGKNAEPMGGVRVVQRDLLGIGKREVVAFGTEGSGFWARLPHNRFVNNVAANLRYAGFNLNGYGMRQAARVPKAPGKAHRDRAVHLGPLRLLEFRGNEVYGAPFGLWTAYYAGVAPGGVGAYARNGAARIEDFVAWHTSHAGISSYHNNLLRLDRPVIRGDVNVAARNMERPSRGIALDTYRFYQNAQIGIHDANIQGHNIGIALPPFTDDQDPGRPNLTLVHGGFLASYVNIMEVGSSLPPGGDKTTVIREVEFGHMNKGQLPGFPPTPVSVWMNFEADFYHKRHAYATRPSRTFLMPTNGASYRLYFAEQSPWTKIPRDVCEPSLIARTSDAVAELEARERDLRKYFGPMRDLLYTVARRGLRLQRPASWPEEVTNAECWDKHGRAIAGELAPCADEACGNGRALDDVVGLAFPLATEDEPLLPALIREAALQ